MRGRANLDTTVPIFIHGDGGPVSHKLSAHILQWGSAAHTAAGSELQTCYMVASWIPEEQEGNSIEAVWKHLLHSFRALASGRFPELDADGQAYPNNSWRKHKAGQLLAPLGGDSDGDSDVGWTAVLISFRADLEYLSNELQMNHHNSETPCCLCHADRAGAPWNHFSDRALWRNTIYSRDAFLQRYRGRHPFFDFPGAGPEMISIDLLHVVDNNGVASHVIANLFYEAIMQRELGNHNKEEGLQQLNARIKTFYSQNQVAAHLPTLSMQNLIDERHPTTVFPVLHGKAIKAANTRGIIPFAAELAAQLDNGTPKRHHRARCVVELNRFYQTVHAAGMFPTAEQSDAIRSSVGKCLKHYCWLAKDAVKAGKMAYNIVPKMHYFFHIGLRSRFSNPRFGQTYINESMVGRVCSIYKASMSGTGDHKVQQKSVLIKYLTGLIVSFTANGDT